jgi:hypothetical protein
MYATKPNGITNRTLNGMTPPPTPFASNTQLAAQQRVANVLLAFAKGTAPNSGR